MRKDIKLGWLALVLLLANVASAQCYSITSIPYAPDPFGAGTGVYFPNDDYHSGKIPIGFSFCFYGNTYDSLVISSNGFVTFHLPAANTYSLWMIQAQVPEQAGTSEKNTIMMPWEDLVTSPNTQNVHYALYGTQPNRYFVVSYDSVPVYGCANMWYSGEVKLFETSNEIEIHVQDKPMCSSWNGGNAILGLQNSDGTMADVPVGYNYPTQWTAANAAWKFTPTCSCVLGIAESKNETFDIFPNPSGGIFTIAIQDGADQVTVTDVMGRIVFQQEMVSGNLALDLTAEAPGVYFCEVRKGNKSGVRKIIVE